MFFFDYWTVFSTLIQFIHELAPRSLWLFLENKSPFQAHLGKHLFGYFLLAGFYFIEKLSLVCTHTPLKVKRDLLFCSSNDLVTSSHGTIFSPFWPLKYPQEKECRWQFSPPLGKIVRLFFTSVEFETTPCSLPSSILDLVILNGTVI